MKHSHRLLSLVLALLCVLCFTACTSPAENPSSTDDTATTTTAPAAQDGVWSTATYTADTTLGKGATAVTVEVTADDKTITFTVNTDAETVGDALLEHDLIAGEEGDYGLYVKSVNGIVADYDVDQTYWAFYIDGEYAMTGVDATTITEGAVYQLVRTK